MISKIQARIAILALTGLLLLSGCVQHPANRPGGEKYIWPENFCHAQNGKLEKIFHFGYVEYNCLVLQKTGIYKRYNMNNISETEYPEWILTEGENK